MHLAVNVATGRKVAVKLMAVRAEDAEDPELRAQLVARFQREAKLAGTVETRHIVRVYDAGLDDIWSMGVLLFKALTGRTPHDEHDTVGQLIVAIVSESPPSAQNFAPWVPPDVAAVVHRALQTKPDRRYPTVSAMLDDVRALLPDGWELRPEMLSPMTDRERGSVRPRRSSQPGAVDDTPTVGSGVSAARQRAEQETLVSPIDGDTHLSATTTNARRRARSSSTALGFVVLAALARRADVATNPMLPAPATCDGDHTLTGPAEADRGGFHADRLARGESTGPAKFLGVLVRTDAHTWNRWSGSKASKKCTAWAR